MSRTIGCALAILLSLVIGPAVSAQSEEQQKPQQPPSKPGAEQGSTTRQERWPWWKDEKFRAEVGFSLAQAAEIDKIFQATVEKAKPLRVELDELDKNINKMLVEASTDLAVFTHTVEKAEARRAELNKMRTVMFYRFRRVFTPEQNAKFRIAFERWEADRKKRDGDRRK